VTRVSIDTHLTSRKASHKRAHNEPNCKNITRVRNNRDYLHGLWLGVEMPVMGSVKVTNVLQNHSTHKGGCNSPTLTGLEFAVLKEQFIIVRFETWRVIQPFQNDNIEIYVSLIRWKAWD